MNWFDYIIVNISKFNDRSRQIQEKQGVKVDEANRLANLEFFKEWVYTYRMDYIIKAKLEDRVDLYRTNDSLLE